LLEQPALNEDAQENKEDNISKLESLDLIVADQLAIQAYINYLFITLPTKEDSTYEEIRPYTNVCVQKSNNWLTFSKALLFRSRNEIDRSKSMERSLAQVQALID